MKQPNYWRHFLSSHSLEGAEVEVPERQDQSGLGVELTFLDEEETRQESEELYPGITVCPDGYVPVGGCSVGTGDPYFINTRDGENGPLYRIYHDAVGVEGYDPQEAVVVVLTDYRELLKWQRTYQCDAPDRALI